jgi:site-specific recombinase XerD
MVARVEKVGIHVLRHSAAMFMMQAGASSKALRLWCGAHTPVDACGTAREQHLFD